MQLSEWSLFGIQLSLNTNFKVEVSILLFTFSLQMFLLFIIHGKIGYIKRRRTRNLWNIGFRLFNIFFGLLCLHFNTLRTFCFTFNYCIQISALKLKSLKKYIYKERYSCLRCHSDEKNSV